MAWAAAIFMASLMARARMSRAPRKMPGKARQLFTWLGKSERPVATTRAPAALAASGWISGSGLARAKTMGSGGHGLHHVLGEDVGPGKPDEDVGAPQGIGQGALLPVRVGDVRQFLLDGVHALGAAPGRSTPGGVADR